MIGLPRKMTEAEMAIVSCDRILNQCREQLDALRVTVGTDGGGGTRAALSMILHDTITIKKHLSLLECQADG